MDRKYYINLFRKMWRDMYEDIVALKYPIDIFDYKLSWLQAKGLRFKNVCPLCEYAHKKNCSERIHDNLQYCKKCPIEWFSENDRYMCENLDLSNQYDGLWQRALVSEDWVEQAALCLMISELPEKKD